MLPSNIRAGVEYREMKEVRERLRDMMFHALGGDLDTYQDYLAEQLSTDANIATFRENIDYLEENGYLLTDEMRHAAENMISWGNELIRMLRESK